MKPATALPWCVSNPDGDTDTQVIQMRDSNPSAVCMGSVENDAAYIVAACNAYPRLIEALREIEKSTIANGRLIASNALRELGE